MKIGAYAVERDYSHYVAYAAKTIFAAVGTATKGPVGVPTVCTSPQELINKFGPLNTNCLALYAGQYFLSQSSKLYFVRAASDSIAAATASIEGSAGESVISDAIIVTALESGTYANDYQIVVEQNSNNYNLVIQTSAGVVLDTITGVALSELNTSYTTRYFTVTTVSSSATMLTAGTYNFSGGDDGITDIDSGDYITAANTLASEQRDMNIFAVPGVSDSSVITAMLALAESRGDCLYLVDPPEGLTRAEIIDWHNGTGEYMAGRSAFNSSYGALYYDWGTIYDSMNKVKVKVPPSVFIPATYAYSDRTTDVWYAPAGLTRGLIKGVLSTETTLSKSDINLLYTGTNAVNSIYTDPQVGLMLWGQKTLARNDTALNRVNVRRLLNYLKRVITAACSYMTFEPNDRVTWNSFEMKISPILKSIQSQRGIYEYRVIRGEAIVTPEDIDNYRMPCMVMIRPTKAAEEIPIYFSITSTGADFNEVLESNSLLINEN